jgi:signal transduction histidine kinase/FixJ family two-component response regulator
MIHPVAAALRGSVLVVDDDRAMRETVVEILLASGIEAEGAGSALEARECQERLGPSVALVDQRLPDATGIEVGTQLKEHDTDLTVLLVTGYANLENAIAAVWQFDGFLTKPVPPVELLRVVRAGLESARLRRENRNLMAELIQSNALLEASVAERTHELSALLAMAETLAAATELDQVVDACVRTASDVTEARYAELYLGEDGPGSPLRLRARTGERGTGSGESVTLTAGGREIGNLVLGTAVRTPPMFLATLAGSAAIAIQNAQRLDRERDTVERLSELSRLKSTFLATVSHELRTPLTAMTGFAEMLQTRFETLQPDDRRFMIEQVVEQGLRLRGLIEDLLDATRVEFGGLRVALEPVGLAAVLARVERSFADVPNPIVTTGIEDLPPAKADAARLEQVLTNLVANAIKHSPPGAAVGVVGTADADHVRIAVVDRGSGIDPAFLANLFDPFTQANGQSGRETGLGLGLYIVRGLVEAMGGSIEAHSRLGQGSEFTVRLQRSMS